MKLSGLRSWYIVVIAMIVFLAGCSDYSSQSITGSTEDNDVAPATVLAEVEEVIDAEELCGEDLTLTIWTGQENIAGSVTINNSGDSLYITAVTTGGWTISASHLHITDDPATFPVGAGGNPQIGQFDYVDSWDPAVISLHYSFLLSDFGLEPGEIVYIALHGVYHLGEQTETGWGAGTPFPGGSWATYMTYTIQRCIPDDPDTTDTTDTTKTIEEGDFRTQTQGGWGTVAHGNNPGVYRDMHFDDAFPNGIVIGKENMYHARFTSSLAVQEFLPAGKKPYMFVEVYENPLKTSAGVLAGQVLALTLSVGFDMADTAFGASAYNLKDLVVADDTSPFYGMTVLEVWEAANHYLGTGGGAYTASQLNKAVTMINENFVDGMYAGDYLMLP